jgi:hypothetical protein
MYVLTSRQWRYTVQHSERTSRLLRSAASRPGLPPSSVPPFQSAPLSWSTQPLMYRNHANSTAPRMCSYSGVANCIQGCALYAGYTYVAWREGRVLYSRVGSSDTEGSGITKSSRKSTGQQRRRRGRARARAGGRRWRRQVESSAGVAGPCSGPRPLPSGSWVPHAFGIRARADGEKNVWCEKHERTQAGCFEGANQVLEGGPDGAERNEMGRGREGAPCQWLCRHPAAAAGACASTVKGYPCLGDGAAGGESRGWEAIRAPVMNQSIRAVIGYKRARYKGGPNEAKRAALRGQSTRSSRPGSVRGALSACRRTRRRANRGLVG